MDKQEAATTLRWFLTNKWGEPEAHAEALRLSDILVGYPANSANGDTGGKPESPKLGGQPIYDLPTGEIPRVALVVGHNAVAKGAYAENPVGAFEYDFNNRVANWIVENSETFEARRFNRSPGSGYGTEIRNAYRPVEAWKPALVVEMHFNAGGGAGSEMLHARSSVKGEKAAGAMQDAFVLGLGLSNRGLKPRSSTERGGLSLHAATAPTVLTEPFFGDNEHDCKRVHEMGDDFARTYIAAIEAALKSLVPG